MIKSVTLDQRQDRHNRRKQAVARNDFVIPRLQAMTLEERRLLQLTLRQYALCGYLLQQPAGVVSTPIGMVAVPKDYDTAASLLAKYYEVITELPIVRH